MVAYAAQIAAQLGANIIKVKPPTRASRAGRSEEGLRGECVPHGDAGAAHRHVVQSCFNGRRIVIFSGGANVSDEKLLDEVRAIHDGGGFGSIIGRNSFQRPRANAVELLGTIMDIYAGPPLR